MTKLPDHTDKPDFKLTGEIRRMASPFPEIIPTVAMSHIDEALAIEEARMARNHYPAM